MASRQELPPTIPFGKWIDTSEPGKDLEGRMVIVASLPEITFLAEVTEPGSVVDMFAFIHKTNSWCLFVGEGNHYTNAKEI